MSAKPPSTKAIEDRIRGAGLRCTRARVAVLGQLLRATGPLTHAEMADELADEGYDRATIYRNLTELTEAQLATRVDLGDHVWRFELKRHHAEGGLGEDHPHCVCTSCGEVSCLDDDDGIRDHPGDYFDRLLAACLPAARTGPVGGAIAEVLDAREAVQTAIAWLERTFSAP